jgi:hypothetical protein
VASLHAPAYHRNPGSLLNRLFSLLTFLAIFTIGWVALSYLKSELAGIDRPDNHASGTGTAVTAPQQKEPVGSPTPSKTEPVLVYSTAADGVNFHTATHLPSNLERTALSEEAARARGLKPCAICMRKQK